MDRKEFQAWLSAVDTLSEAQKAEAGEILSGRPAGEASLAAIELGVGDEALNQSAGERVRGELHIQTVNNRHSRLKDFLRARRGIATRYLDSYLRWFHLIGLHPDPTARYCLAAAMGGVTVNTIHE